MSMRRLYGHPVRMNTQKAITALRERLEKGMEQKA